MNIEKIQKKSGIVGRSESIKQVLEMVAQVAPVDISVLITGESGTGKEIFAKAIHQNSKRSHEPMVTVNCGAIPEGIIESELFGHKKGAYTDAKGDRKGYFETANKGTIFLDEVGELPLTTQVRLLRVMENGEFIKVGSSQVQKTNVRIVCATNLNMQDAIKKGKFREDLFYRLSTVEISLPPLRERKEDITLLFRKFASDFAQKYKMPTLRLDQNSEKILTQYNWEGNIRQLKNVAEQMSVLEKEREVVPEVLKNYIPEINKNLPALIDQEKKDKSFSSEREILYKVLFDMKSDLNDLKKLTLELMENDNLSSFQKKNLDLINKIYGEKDKNTDNSLEVISNKSDKIKENQEVDTSDKYEYAETVVEEEPLSLIEKENEMIKKALIRSNGKRN